MTRFSEPRSLEEVLALLAPFISIYRGRALIVVCQWPVVAVMVHQVRFVTEPHPVVGMVHVALLQNRELFVAVAEGKADTVDEEDEDSKAEDSKQGIHANFQIWQTSRSLSQVAVCAAG